MSPSHTDESQNSDVKIELCDCYSPLSIEQRSLAIIDAEAPEPRPFNGYPWEIVRRMIHASADFELLSLVSLHPKAVEAGLAALKAGCLIVTDVEMARMAIPERRLKQLGCTIKCLISDPDVVKNAEASGVTRAQVAMDAALTLNPAIYVVGNAPTYLLRLLEYVRQGRSKPALIVGMPVGFVNAAESKELLMAQDEIPFISLRGRKGGSPLAGAAVNALAEIALRERS